MAAIGKVSAIFTASTSGLTVGARQAGSAMRSLQAEVSGLRGSMATLVAINGAQLFGSIVSGVSQAVRSMVSMGQAQAEVIDGQSKMAARLGMTYGEFAGLALAGDLAGVSMETIGAAATKADVAFVKASQGSKQAQAAFSRLGLNLEQLSGMNASERFDAIAGAIAGLPTEAERAAAAVQLFGKAGAQLLPLFAGGAEGIAQAREQAERLGLALTTAQGQDVEAMNDAFTLAGQAINGVVQQVVAYLAPAIQGVADTFTNLVGNIGGANIGKAIGDGILDGAEFLAGIGDYLITNFGSVFTYLSAVGQQWGGVVSLFSRTTLFLSGVGDGLQAAFGLIITGISGPVQSLMEAAQFIGDRLGFDTSGLDAAVAGMQAFNEEVSGGITENLNSAAANISAALAADAPQVGQAVAGPLVTSLRQARDEARAAADQVEQAKPAPVDVQQTVQVAGVTEALKAVDSRSKEGVAEMFRLMRGNGGNIEERQLGVLEEIRDGLTGAEEIPPFAIEG
jgi:hypothetical protein